VAAAWLERAAVSPPRVRSADLRAEGALSPWSFAPLFALLLGVALAGRAGARGPDAESALPSTGLRVSAGGCLGALVGSQLLGYVVAAASGPGASGLLASVFAQHAVLLVASAALLRVGGAGRAQWLPGFGSVSPRARVELTALAGALLLAAWAVSRGLGDVSESPLAAALEVVSNRYVIAYTALLAPLAEELFFRGALQASLGRERPAAGVVASGAVFTALHAQQLQGAWLGLVPIALLALANGWLRLRTRGLTAPWLVHTLYNGALVLSVLRG
jgi:membrane protease YdiL (CAAX protease family)